MTQLIAVDPGDVHVGVAFFETDEPDPWTGEGGADWACVDTQEWEPMEFADALGETMFEGSLNTLVYERFRLYADKAPEQTGSEFETSQLIGILKYLVRLNNNHVAKHHQVNDIEGRYLPCEMQGGGCTPRLKMRHVNLVGQMADIKKPTTGVLRSRKIKSTAKRQKTGGHCVDAELHGWHFILNGDHDALAAAAAPHLSSV